MIFDVLFQLLSDFCIWIINLMPTINFSLDTSHFNMLFELLSTVEMFIDVPLYLGCISIIILVSQFDLLISLFGFIKRLFR